MAADTTGRLDLAKVKARVRLTEVVADYVDLRRQAGEHVGLCPFHSERTPSFTVNEEKGFYHCFGCGAHGDVGDFVMRIEGLAFRSAVSRLAEGSGLEHSTAVGAVAARKRRRREQLHRAEDARRRTAYARGLWRKARRIAGTVAEAYLLGRGIRPSARGWPATLRFSNRLAYWSGGDPLHGSKWPGLLAAVQVEGVSGAASVLAVHRTYLTRDGSGKAPVSKPKKVLGPYAGGAIRFASPRPRVVLAEGIETALSVLMACPWEAVWAAVSLTNMSRVRLPSTVREVVLAMDGDSKDERVVERVLRDARRNYGRRRVRVAWPPAGADFNDVLRGAA